MPSQAMQDGYELGSLRSDGELAARLGRASRMRVTVGDMSADQDPFSTPAMLRQLASDYLAGADPKTRPEDLPG
jgi:hypothetical protein